MDDLKPGFLLGWHIFRGYVSFRESGSVYKWKITSFFRRRYIFLHGRFSIVMFVFRGVSCEDHVFENNMSRQF